MKDINVTLGGCAFWHAVISIRKQAGEGKNALLAALSVMDLKHVVVVDDDIDVLQRDGRRMGHRTPRAGRQGRVIVIPGARAKPLDPSLAVMPPGVVPTGAKVGIDATIGEGIPHERFERIAYAYADRAKIADYVAGKADPVPANVDPDDKRIAALAQHILALIEKTPLYYSELADKFREHPSRSWRARSASCIRRKSSVAGPARPPVRARLGVCRQAAGQKVNGDAAAPPHQKRPATPAPRSPSPASANGFASADGQPLHVLQDIDLDVAEHSIFAILGASGCGKSTLLNIISGIVRPDRGQVCFGGVPAKQFNDWRSVSYMFQEDRLLPWRTALAQRRVRAGGRFHAARRSAGAAPAKRWSSSASPASKTRFPISSRAACAAASRSRAASCSSRASC